MNKATVSKIEVKNVFKIFGNRAKDALAMVGQGKTKDQVLAETGCVVGVNDLSLSIGSGEIFVIMGLSGSGKSTLVRHFNRLIDPTSGAILVDGVDILQYDMEALREFRRRKISMVFQSFGLLPHKTVLDNVAYGLKIRGESKQMCAERALHWINTVGLKGYENKYPHQLSGGMRQRVGLARALAADTDIILMDEAFSALDPLIRAEMQDQLLELQKTLHKTIVFITHDLDEAVRIGNRIAILKDGRLIQVGTPKRSCIRRPMSMWTALCSAGRRWFKRFCGESSWPLRWQASSHSNRLCCTEGVHTPEHCGSWLASDGVGDAASIFR